MRTGDPELDKVIAELQEIFRKRTAEELPQIEVHYAALLEGKEPHEQARSLRIIVHRIAGSAGSFGFPELSRAATPFDDALGHALKQGEAEILAAAPGWRPLLDAVLDAARAL